MGRRKEAFKGDGLALLCNRQEREDAASVVVEYQDHEIEGQLARHHQTTEVVQQGQGRLFKELFAREVGAGPQVSADRIRYPSRR